MQNRTLPVSFKRKQEVAVSGGQGVEHIPPAEASISSSLVQWGLTDGRPGEGAGREFQQHVPGTSKNPCWFCIKHKSDFPYLTWNTWSFHLINLTVSFKKTLFNFRKSPNKAAALTVPEGGDWFFPLQVKGSIFCATRVNFPSTSHCLRWGGSRVKISMGERTASFTSKQTKGGGLFLKSVFRGPVFISLCASIYRVL